MPRHSLQRQRGGTTLIVTAVLALAMLLTVGWLNRHLVVEQRMAAHQQRATQAFHAAEAGVDWALARLNEPRAVDDRCRPEAGAAGSFLDRHLGTSRPARCTHSAAGWQCRCDDAPGDDPSDAARFTVVLERTSRPDAIRVVATGRAAGSADARIETVAARLGAVTGRPAAALTARGSIDTAAAALGAHNADARSGGLVLHAGGPIRAASARLEPPGAMPRADAVVGDDATLAGRDADAFFTATFGTAAETWRTRPGVLRVDCGSGDCGAALREAIGDGTGHRMLWIDGDVALDGPVTLGSAERPVVLVASGAARLRGDVALHGLLHASALAWSGGSGPSATVRGAVVIDGHVSVDTAADLVRDRAVLDHLAHDLGSWVRVPGSWRDF